MIQKELNKQAFTLHFRESPIFVDPRDSDLGARIISPLEKLYLTIKKLELKPCKYDEYYNFSYNLGIAQLDMNKLKNKIFGIECNFEELNGIDFKKGCYVGQENTSRIKLKNKLSKRLLPIKIISGKINIDDEIKIDNKSLGKVLINKKYPFAIIKFKDEKFNYSQEYMCNSAKIKFIKPIWI